MRSIGKDDAHPLGHPLHVGPGHDDTDYTERNGHFIRCLQALEVTTNLDAHIIDYQNKRILYITKNSLIYNEELCDNTTQQDQRSFGKIRD